MKRRISAALIFLGTLAVANQALACSVCAVANDEARHTYYFTTALLSLLPLMMIGGIIYTVVKKTR